MQSIESLKQEAEKDLHFDIKSAEDHAIRLSSARNRWSQKAMDWQMRIVKAEGDLEALYGVVHRRIMSDSDLAVDRRDAPSYVKSDPEYRKAADKLAILKITLKYIDSVLTSLREASFDIGNAIKFVIFKGGA